MSSAEMPVRRAEPSDLRDVPGHMVSLRMVRALVAIFVGTLLVVLSPAWAAAQQEDVGAFVGTQMSARHSPDVACVAVQAGRRL